MDLAQPRRVEHQQTDKGYVPVYTTCLLYTSPSPRDS